MCPLTPFGGYFSACWDGGGEFGGGAAVTHYFLVGYCHCWVVVWPLALDAVWGGRGREAGVSVLGFFVR